MSNEIHIDLSYTLNAIRHKYGPRYFANDQAIKEAQMMWGKVCNVSGVFTDYTEEIIAKVGRCEAALTFCHSSKNYWTFGLSAKTSFTGWGFAPTIWDRIAYTSCYGARLEGVKQLIKFFEGTVRDKSSCNSISNIENASQVLRILEAEKTPQLELF